MASPRQVLPGGTYMITRRTQRQFLLRPDPEINNAFNPIKTTLSNTRTVLGAGADRQAPVSPTGSVMVPLLGSHDGDGRTVQRYLISRGPRVDRIVVITILRELDGPPKPLLNFLCSALPGVRGRMRLACLAHRRDRDRPQPDQGCFERDSTRLVPHRSGWRSRTRLIP
jgi:hypothetical protein